MRFRILSHAAIDIEGAARLMIDPWLSGSCYWDSWWHFPEAVAPDRPLRGGDFVYLTHGHPDHLHEPTLREIDRDVTLLIPRLPVSYMREAVDALGFGQVAEIDHGATLELAPGFRVTSYQTGWINDSILVVESEGTRIADLNDALFPRPVLEAIAARHAPIDFALKSHSSAGAYPHAFESPDPGDLSLYTEADFVGNFFHYARIMRARYAVPFASNVCFLHEESRPFNRDVISPRRILEEQQRQPAGTPEVKVLLPGDGWSSEHGFTVGDHAVLERRDREIERLAREAAPALAARRQREAGRELRFADFADYFGGLVRCLPRPLRWLYRASFAFELPVREGGGDPEWWVVDFAKTRVERLRARPATASAVIRVGPGLLAEAIEQRLVGFVDISKRVRVELRAGEIVRYAIFRELVSLYDGGYFPLRRSLTSRRFVGAWLRRWRELLAYAAAALRGPLAFVPGAPKDEVGPTP